MCFETIQELVHMDRTCVAKNIFGETRVSKTSNSRNLETEVSPWKRVRCNIFRSHYARGILKSPIILYWCWLNPIFWQNSRTQYGSWITFSVKSTRQATNFSMRTELTSWINSYSTKQATDSGRDTCFSRETNYQPAPYSRFNLYCAMRFVHVNDFNKCIGKYAVPGG